MKQNIFVFNKIEKDEIALGKLHEISGLVYVWMNIFKEEL